MTGITPVKSLPSLILYGENYAGKTVIAEALRNNFEFNIFSMSNFWLDRMREDYPTKNIFGNDEITSFRDKYIALNGTSRIIEEIIPKHPTIVDGVRSLNIARGLTNAGFIPVYVTAPFVVRLRRADMSRPLATGKIAVAPATLERHDMMHAGQIASIQGLGGFAIDNDGANSPQYIANRLVSMLAMDTTIK